MNRSEVIERLWEAVEFLEQCDVFDYATMHALQEISGIIVDLQTRERLERLQHA